MTDDTISRQVAIDAVKKSMYENPHKNETHRSMHDHEHRHFLTILMGLPSAQSEQRWIPVKKKLPKRDEDYKSCMECLDGAVWYFTENGSMGLGYYSESTKQWSTTTDLKTDGKVIAWTSLPAAYREEDGNEKTD